MSELKPCPFCGCTDNFITVTSNPFSNDIYSTTHCKCYATGPFIAENYLTGEKVPTRESMEDKATERWNTRPIEDTLNKRIAELKETHRWRVVADGELPEKCRDERNGELIPFLVCGDGTEYPFTAVYDGELWNDGMFVVDITHWMPLPELPEVQE